MDVLSAGEPIKTGHVRFPLQQPMSVVVARRRPLQVVIAIPWVQLRPASTAQCMIADGRDAEPPAHEPRACTSVSKWMCRDPPLD
jgi:hypothetical protein